jgi:hypothetical protein
MWWQFFSSKPCAQLVDPVADHLRRRPVEDPARVDDRAGTAAGTRGSDACWTEGGSRATLRR